MNLKVFELTVMSSWHEHRSDVIDQATYHERVLRAARMTNDYSNRRLELQRASIAALWCDAVFAHIARNSA
jgi:hypothetical protein